MIGEAGHKEKAYKKPWKIKGGELLLLVEALKKVLARLLSARLVVCGEIY